MPDKPRDKLHADLVKVLTDHFSPKPLEIVQHLKSYNCSRKLNKSISVFMPELHSLAEHCNFGHTLDTMIWDRVV